MSSIMYAGHDLGAYVTADLAEPVAHAVRVRTAEVPGRAGLLPVWGDVEPLRLSVNVWLDRGTMGAERLMEARRTLRAWLLSPAGGTLEVPGEPGLEWRDAVCAGVSTWSSLLSDGHARVEFDCLDPIAYGAARETGEATLDVAGTWATWPTYELVATGGAGVSVTEGGVGVTVGRTLRAGDRVVVDCAAQSCTVNGADALADVSLGSDFPSLSPGRHYLQFGGCASHVARWRERWA